MPSAPNSSQLCRFFLVQQIPPSIAAVPGKELSGGTCRRFRRPSRSLIVRGLGAGRQPHDGQIKKRERPTESSRHLDVDFASGFDDRLRTSVKFDVSETVFCDHQVM